MSEVGRAGDRESAVLGRNSPLEAEGTPTSHHGQAQRSAGDERILKAVIGAREAGLSWEQISELLGVSRREARRRYAKVVERPRVSKRQLKRAARAKRANLRARG